MISSESTSRTGDSASSRTSDVVDVDAQLDLIETEDGYIRSPSSTSAQVRPD